MCYFTLKCRLMSPQIFTIHYPFSCRPFRKQGKDTNVRLPKFVCSLENSSIFSAFELPTLSMKIEEDGRRVSMVLASVKQQQMLTLPFDSVI